MKKFLWTLLFAAFLMPMAAHAQCTDGTPCQFTIYGEDTYGDGWEGDLYIYRNNVAIDTFTVDYDEDSLTYTVCAGDLIRIDWAGADQYYENYFTIISNGVTLVSNAGGITYAPSGTVVQFIACPSCSPVTAPAVTGLTSSSCTLTWTDANNSGATYTIYDMSDTTVVATGINTTSYTINTLTPATAYAFGIVANCSATDESSPVIISFTSPCEAIALPFAESFATTSNTVSCWGLVASGNVGGSYGAGLVDINGYSAFRFSSYSSASDYNQYLYSPLLDVSGSATGLMVNVRYATYGSNDQLKFGYITSTDTVWDPTTYTTTGSSDWQVYSMAIPATAQQLVVHYYGSYSYYAWIDSVNVAEITSSFCYAVTGLTASNITSDSVTLTWSDANNSGVTYTVYNMADTSVVATSVNDTTYTIDNLNANTVYTFGVAANCSSTSESDIVTVNARTACGITAIPYTEGFEGMATNATPVCWSKPTSGNAYVTTSTTHTGSNKLKFSGVAGNNMIVLPEFDEEISGLQVRFWTRPESITSANCGTFSVGYVTDPAVDSTFVVKATYSYNDWTAAAYEEKSVAMTGAPTGARIAFRHDANSTAWYWYVDDVTVEEVPSCLPVNSLSASNITDNSITITWSDTVNSGATYTVYDMADTSVVAANVSTTSYTVTGLTPNTYYTFGVEVNCSATDVARIITVSTRTDCGVEMLPFTEDFSATLSSDPCWRGASNATASQVFAGTALTLGNPSSWTYTSSTRDGFAAGHYYKNVYGSSVKSWMITPAIDLSTVSSAQLSFDVALTDYYNAALPDVDGDTNTSQAFMVIISTDGGNTWDSTNATIWQNVGGDYTYASLASLTYQNKVIDLTPYAGDTIKIAFYCQSLWSGGDNDLHLDNIAVTEIGGGDTTVVADSCTLIISVNDPTMGTTTPAPGIYMHATTDSAVTITALPYTGHTFSGWHISILADSSMFDTTFYVADPALNYMMVDFSTTTAGAICSVTALFNNGSVVDSGYYLTVNYDSTMGDVYYFDGPYQAGDSAFVWAMANPGYRFVSFTEGTTVVSTDAFYEFVMTADRTLTANFEVDTNASADSLTLIFAVNDATMGTTTPAPGTYRYGEGDVFTVTATPNSGYFFAGWVLSMDLGGFIYNDTMSVYDGVPTTLSDTVTYDYLGMVMGLTALFTADSMPVINTDSVTITLAVNDATMGTISPAPGTYTYAETDSIHIVATPNNGYYFIGWRFQTSIYGMDIDTVILTNENYFHETLEDMGGMSLTLTAMFSADTNVTLYTVNVAVNDATMGSISGAGQYVAGTTATLTATPREGYTFVGWVIGNDTLTANPYTFTVTADVNVLAIFTAGSTGIEDADMTNVNVYSAESRIIVRGAEGKDVYVYDLNGRMVSSQLNAADAVEFRMANTGVYLVKVGTASAKRVLVVR